MLREEDEYIGNCFKIFLSLQKWGKVKYKKLPYADLAWKYIFLSVIRALPVSVGQINPMCLSLKRMCYMKVPGIIMFSYSLLPPLLLQIFRIKIIPLKPVRVYCLVHRLSKTEVTYTCILGWLGVFSPCLTMSTLPSNCCWSCNTDFLVISMAISLNKLEFVFVAWLISDNTQGVSKKSYNLTWICRK